MIPYALQLDVFRPHPKSIAREVFGLPSDPNVPLIAFGAPGGTKDPRKGWDLLAPALRLISNRLPAAQAVVLGQSAPASPPRVGMPLHFVGRLSDDVSLALLYGAADVMVVPSRQDNLPQTAVEAQSCGTPVVAFRTGGLADTLEDRVTGYLADAFDIADLATGIAWVLDGPSSLSRSARERALALWSPAMFEHLTAVGEELRLGEAIVLEDYSGLFVLEEPVDGARYRMPTTEVLIAEEDLEVNRRTVDPPDSFANLSDLYLVLGM